ncbi:MAG: adenosylcobinamide-phosphate synthase CbiB [Acidobacteriota bacterium]|nr:adenosylcobinamide-phosphate synthase CbiB [Acidobacteriota bacterium]
MTLALAWLLDLAAGDPEWFPHPVRVIGIAVLAGERLLLRSTDTAERSFVKGAMLTAGITFASWKLTRWAVQKRAVLDVVLAWTTLALRNLLDEASAVIRALDKSDIALARTRLARIVGRDTDHLDENEIARAAIETLAESACDGVIAPLMWLAIGGTPAAMAYKAVNTLDSMIGHREPPYMYFGRAAARLDDAANWLPARLTALCIVAAARSGWQVWRRDGDRHLSPNAGQCEAAMAGALSVRLGGLNFYDGIPVQGAVFGGEARSPERRDVRRAIRLTAIASFLAFAVALGFQRRIR